MSKSALAIYAKQFASLGGKARAKSLSAKRRREIASLGGKAKKRKALAQEDAAAFKAYMKAQCERIEARGKAKRRNGRVRNAFRP